MCDSESVIIVMIGTGRQRNLSVREDESPTDDTF